ncbi:MAG TPA: YCF48-related protein [Verrucomicrobiae bacterium]|nr:YCF48-related protein [Verrucomicrobiae bacterium]
MARWGLLIPISLLPLFAADERTCTMRDAALPTNNQTVVLCEQGLVLVTADEGATWSTRRITQTGGFRAIAFIDSAHGLVVGDGGKIFATEDTGRTWQPRTSGVTENLTDIQMMGNEGWIAGYTGTMLHTADGGKTWAKQDSGTALSLEALFFLDNLNGWAVGWSGTVLHTTDGGKVWKPVKNTGASWSLSSVYFSDVKAGYISGFAGQFFRTKDGGATWETRKVPVSGWLTSIAHDSAGRLWVTTDDGFLITQDAGDTWKLQPAVTKLFINKLLRNTGSIWALGPFGLLKQQGNGLEFKRIMNPLSGDADQQTTPTPQAK